MFSFCLFVLVCFVSSRRRHTRCALVTGVQTCALPISSEPNMKSRAAVAFAPGQPLQLVELDVEPPRAGEVLVRITHTALCHTDAFTLSGDDPEGVFPEIGRASCRERVCQYG